jgi:helix-turn-helix protein
MSIKISAEVWQCSQHKSGNLLVLLAVADHADDRGTAWPGIRSLARKARLSQRHTRRCLNKLVASGELEVLPNQAPSGRSLYKIRFDKLHPDNLSVGTCASDSATPMSVSTDADDRPLASPYIEEPSTESSEEPTSNMKTQHPNPKNPRGIKLLRRSDSIGLVSQPNNGF